MAEQSLAWQRQTTLDRIALLTKEAAFHHNDDDRIEALGAAAANAARAHARVGDAPLGAEVEDTAAATARSGVLSAAIGAKLDAGNLAGGAALLDRSTDRLDPAHAALVRARLDTLQRAEDAGVSAGQPEPGTAPVQSDATPEPIVAGQQYAQNGASGGNRGPARRHRGRNSTRGKKPVRRTSKPGRENCRDWSRTIRSSPMLPHRVGVQRLRP